MPPNQFAHATSRTPLMLRIASAWLVGIVKMSDVDRIVTTRVDELASAAAWKPSRTARRAVNRKTAIATLITVSTVRRLLRRAPLKIRPRNFIGALSHLRLLDQRALLEVQNPRGTLGGVRIVRHHDDRLLEFRIEPLNQRQHL